jgi:beta-glucosidase/6-phospho-beta-glucosidase/beta-galactosidase
MYYVGTSPLQLARVLFCTIQPVPSGKYQYAHLISLATRRASTISRDIYTSQDIGIVVAGTSFGSLPCQARYGDKVTSAHRVEVEVVSYPSHLAKC